MSISKKADILVQKWLEVIYLWHLLNDYESLEDCQESIVKTMMTFLIDEFGTEKISYVQGHYIKNSGEEIICKQTGCKQIISRKSYRGCDYDCECEFIEKRIWIEIGSKVLDVVGVLTSENFNNKKITLQEYKNVYSTLKNEIEEYNTIDEVHKSIIMYKQKKIAIEDKMQLCIIDGFEYINEILRINPNKWNKRNDKYRPCYRYIVTEDRLKKARRIQTQCILLNQNLQAILLRDIH